MSGKTILRVILGSALVAASALVYADNDPYDVSDSAPLHSTVKSLSLSQTGVIPTIVVESKGNENKYDFVNLQAPFSAKMNFEVDCRGLYGVNNVYAGVSTKPVHGWDKYKNPDSFAYWTHPIKESAGYKTKRSGTTTFTGNISKTLADNAIKFCNNRFLANGGDIHKGATFQWLQVGDPYVPYKMHLYGQCGNHADAIAGGLKVNYQCKAKPQKLTMAEVSFFEITKVEFKPVQPKYAGICPKEFPFTGAVKTNGTQGQFRYRLVNHHGVTGSWKSVETQSGKSHYDIQHTITLQDIQLIEQPGMPNQIQGQQAGMTQLPQLGLQENPWVTLEVENIKNRKKYQQKASYRYTCTQPPKLQVSSLVTDHMPGNGKPDLVVLGNTFRLGSKTVSAAGSLVIGAEEASKKIGGQCQFRSVVKIKNQGQGDANTPFGTRITRDNVTLHIGNLAGLNKNQEGNISGNLVLPAGQSTLLIRTDHANKVEESNEGNNSFRIMVTVKGDCGKQTPDRSEKNEPMQPSASNPLTHRPTRQIGH